MVKNTPMVVALATTLSASAVSAAPLVFDTPVQAATGNSVVGSVVTATQIDFLNVATDQGTTVDLRVTAAVKDQTDFGVPTSNGAGDAGFIPDYSNAGAPEDDLGFLFFGNGINTTENGIVLTFDFFNGTGALSGTFTDAFTVAELNFAIYDVDGEPSQSEYFTAFKSGGLTSYALGDTPQALVATDLGDGVRFDGPGTNFPESDSSGAAMLTFTKTASFVLDFGAVQTGGPVQNGVFTAFDGDLSLFDPSDFRPPVSTVPVPAGLPLIASALGGLALLRRRKA